VQGGEKCPSKSFPPKIFCYWVEERQIKKTGIFSKQLFGWCKEEKMKKKTAFYGKQNRGI
jgi:hypothetical protein